MRDPALALELLGFLRSRGDAVSERVGASELEVSLLGSYGREGQRRALESLVRAWLAGRSSSAGAVELLDERRAARLRR